MGEKVSYTQEMKRSAHFGESLGRYALVKLRASPLPEMLRITLQAGLPRVWSQVATVLVAGVVLLSIMYGAQSTAGLGSAEEVIKRAAQLGDYDLASQLYEQCEVSRCQGVTGNVLGTESDPTFAETSLEEMVYPEKKVWRRILELEEGLTRYPGHREVYLTLARLYGEVGVMDKAQEYREKARVLDPNGVEFR